MNRDDFSSDIMQNWKEEIDLAWPTLEGPRTDMDKIFPHEAVQMAIRDGIRTKYAKTIDKAKRFHRAGIDPAILLGPMLETIRESAPELEETIMKEIYSE